MPICFSSMAIDALTLSAHKIGGPQGVGALVVKECLPLRPLIRGGGQERNRRSGTENVAGIIGFGLAAQLAADDLRDMPRIQALRDTLEDRISYIGGRDTVVIGACAPRIANTSLIALPGVPSETQVVSMDLGGVAVSAGSACSSGKVRQSHVLSAMGYAPDVAGSVLRFSLGWHTQNKDIDRCIDAWKNLYQHSRRTRITKAA